ncbi:MAG TPA: HD domain-containing phosphohydrolase [Longimicrobiales bacterium]
MSASQISALLAGCRVLVADDEPAMRDVIARSVRRWGAVAVEAASVADAIARLEADTFDLIISDVNMPGRSGIDLVREVRGRWPTLAVLMITGALDPTTPIRAFHDGVDRFLLKPFTLDELRDCAEQALAASRARRRAAAEVEQLTRELRAREGEVRELVLRGVRSLVAAVEAKHPYTRGHSERVSRYAVAIARALGGLDTERIALAGELHDIGKIGIPDHILNKPGRLTHEEMLKVMEHPAIGRRILEPLIDDAEILATVLHHHERWDGRGYPHGLAGPDIPRAAQVLALADTFDALTSSRAYRAARAVDRAAEVILSEEGRQFSPEVVAAFRVALPELEETLRAAALAAARSRG